jgi:hypothetical protein
MAFSFFYGHNSGKTGATGFDVLATGGNPPAEVLAKCQKIIEADLRLEGRSVALDMGWCWLPVDQGSRMFARSQAGSRADGSKTLQVRGIVLDHDECNRIGFNPFLIRSRIEDHSNWNLDDSRKLPPPELPSAMPDKTHGNRSLPEKIVIPWDHAGNRMDALAESMLLRLHEEARKEFSFAGPVPTSEFDASLVFARKNFQSNPKPALADAPKPRPGPWRKVALTLFSLNALIALALFLWKPWDTFERLETELDKKSKEVEILTNEQDQLIEQANDLKDELQRERSKIAALKKTNAELKETLDPEAKAIIKRLEDQISKIRKWSEKNQEKLDELNRILGDGESKVNL